MATTADPHINTLLEGTPEDFRRFAKEQFDKSDMVLTAPKQTSILDSGNQLLYYLQSLSFSESEFEDDFLLTQYPKGCAAMGLALNSRTYVGRLVLSAAFIDDYFPKEPIMGAEVVQHAGWNSVPYGTSKEQQRGHAVSLLKMEEPHYILESQRCEKGCCFDPAYPGAYSELHVRKQFPLWDLLFSSYLCLIATTTSNFDKQKIAIKKAGYYARTVEVLYQEIARAIDEDDTEHVAQLCYELLGIKESARARFLLAHYEPEKEHEHIEKLNVIYSREALSILWKKGKKDQ